MSKLKQVLRMFKNGGMSNRKIAETVDLDKNTVNKYVNHYRQPAACGKLVRHDEVKLYCCGRYSRQNRAYGTKI